MSDLRCAKCNNTIRYSMSVTQSLHDWGDIYRNKCHCGHTNIYKYPHSGYRVMIPNHQMPKISKSELVSIF